ncbi:apolipoprotein N-acyltransferase [Spirochaeta cellobiosiphila]|uniref:apolipoprotein N-acyltransferase n=1 Tax=Spirochaeta cellobiosiphila TaxID=504483 RepID=UPI000403D75A|nr:apolipoprotein N-acyltransferase [Spirochaeta cellobiosiphila]
MAKEQNLKRAVSLILVEVALLSLSALLFALSFPSFLSLEGWGFLGFFALIPLVPVIKRSGWIKAFLYGPLYALITYSIFNYWLTNFHPVAGLVVNVIYMFYFFFLFPALKAVDVLWKDWAFLPQCLLWMAYEYIRTKGFVGYPYGIMAYSQYKFIPFIQSASFWGIWGVSLLVIFPSFYIGRLLSRPRREYKEFWLKSKWWAFGYAIVFLGNVVFGLISQVDYSQSPTKRISLIQHDIDPWKGGISAYKKGLDRLIDESKKAVKDNPDLVVWSETAFVPPVFYHTQYRENQQSYELVKELNDFLSTQQIPYLFGNDHAEKHKNSNNQMERIDYNAALLWDKGDYQQIYKKIHLVPFTEHFPYEKSLPFLYNFLKTQDVHWWGSGTEYTVFEAAGLKFAATICFEDVFGYLSRNFVRQGADVIVNITNDSWAFSVVSMMQHLSISTFRAVENRRSLVRSANGGMTAVVDPNGRILAEAEPFTKTHLTYDVPVYTDSLSVYTKFGDWSGILFMILGLASLIVGLCKSQLTRAKSDS